MSLVSWLSELPLITRWYLLISSAVTALCFFEILSPLQLYYNHKRVIEKLELWRLVGNFFFFGLPGLDFFFHMYFMVRYCRLLEEDSFRTRKADFFWMLLFGAVIMLLIAPYLGIPYLGFSLTFLMLYVWGRRNGGIHMVFFIQELRFRAPYLPWVLLVFSMLLGGSPVVDLLGIGVGHIYYFFEDVLPNTTGRYRGVHLLRTPAIIKHLFGEGEPAVAPAFRFNLGGGLGGADNNNNNIAAGGGEFEGEHEHPHEN